MSAAGCVVHTYPEEELVHGHAVVRVESAPAHIHTYPRVHYHDGYAYLVEDRWYYHGPRGWAVFRSHPRELEAQRVRIIREHRPDRHRPPRYYEERRAPSRAKEPDERGRRYYDD